MFHLADIWAARTNTDVRIVSANDHVHARGSAHYMGVAIDVHASDLDGFARMMRRAGYRVLWRVPGHYTHVHVELGDPDLPDLGAGVLVRADARRPAIQSAAR